MTTTTSHNDASYGLDQTPRRLTTETKAALKTTEFFAFVAAVLAVIVTANLYDGNGDGADPSAPPPPCALSSTSPSATWSPAASPSPAAASGYDA